MYEKHFGLNSRPFDSKAEGDDVFVGSQQMSAVTRLHKGLIVQDAVVTVSGPVGVGKTTLVTRALQTLPTGRLAGWLGRIQLTPDEVLRLLLAGFGVGAKTRGKIGRFAAFRRLLQEQSAKGVPVAIVVEDAHRIGCEALVELEAVTAADTGDGSGANIILMGQAGLNELLSTPELARLKQRVRLRNTVDPLSACDVQEYLEHRIKRSSGSYDSIFDDGVAEIIYGCSEGIPRIVNTLCEAALNAAMDNHSTRVTLALMAQVAADGFGYAAPIPVHVPVEVNNAEESDSASTDEHSSGSKEDLQEIEASAQIKITDKPPIGHDIIVESGSYPVKVDAGSSDPIIAVDERAAEEPLAGEDPVDEFPVAGKSLDPPKLVVCDELAPIDDVPEQLEDEDTHRELTILPGMVNALSADIVCTNDGSAAIEPDASAKTVPDTESDIGNGASMVTPILSAAEDYAALDQFNATRSEPVPDQESASVPDPSVALADKPDPIAAPEVETTVDAAAETDVDLPMLSDSMRINVLRERRPPALKDPVSQSAETFDLDTSSNLELMPADRIEEEVATVEEPDTESASSVEDQVTSMLEQDYARSVERSANGIDSLQAALEVAKRAEAPSPATVLDSPLQLNELPGEIDAAHAPAAPAIPEITLDNAISERREQDNGNEQVAEEIAAANSLEDMSDHMAETLFGSAELDQIAAEVVANPPSDLESSPDALDPPSPVKLNEPSDQNAMTASINKAPAVNIASTETLTLEETGVDHLKLDAAAKSKPAVAATTGLSSPGMLPGDIPLNESVAMRIDILNKMKNNAAKLAVENVELGETELPPPSQLAGGDQPEPIESQINTSITQTLKALDLSRMAEAENDEKKEKKSTGLFSRFKKSS